MKQRLERVRAELARQGLDGFLVPRADEHLGEYVPAAAERLAWLTGFTGSAGLAIVLPDLLLNHGHFDASWTNPRLMAGVAATAFYVATRRMLGMIFVGMGVFTVLRLWG